MAAAHGAVNAMTGDSSHRLDYAAPLPWHRRRARMAMVGRWGGWWRGDVGRDLGASRDTAGPVAVLAAAVPDIHPPDWQVIYEAGPTRGTEPGDDAGDCKGDYERAVGVRGADGSGSTPSTRRQGQVAGDGARASVGRPDGVERLVAVDVSEVRRATAGDVFHISVFEPGVLLSGPRQWNSHMVHTELVSGAGHEATTGPWLVRSTADSRSQEHRAFHLHVQMADQQTTVDGWLRDDDTVALQDQRGEYALPEP